MALKRKIGETQASRMARQRLEDTKQKITSETVLKIPVEKLVENKFNSEIPVEDLNELAESIREVGLMNPVLVYAREDGSYEIISGHRRVRAMRDILNLSEIPCIKKKYLKRPLMTLVHSGESGIQNYHSCCLPVIKIHLCQLRQHTTWIGLRSWALIPTVSAIAHGQIIGHTCLYMKKYDSNWKPITECLSHCWMHILLFGCCIMQMIILLATIFLKSRISVVIRIRMKVLL